MSSVIYLPVLCVAEIIIEVLSQGVEQGWVLHSALGESVPHYPHPPRPSIQALCGAIVWVSAGVPSDMPEGKQPPLPQDWGSSPFAQPPCSTALRQRSAPSAACPSRPTAPTSEGHASHLHRWDNTDETDSCSFNVPSPASSLHSSLHWGFYNIIPDVYVENCCIKSNK